MSETQTLFAALARKSWSSWSGAIGLPCFRVGGLHAEAPLVFERSPAFSMSRATGCGRTARLAAAVSGAPVAPVGATALVEDADDQRVSRRSSQSRSLFTAIEPRVEPAPARPRGPAHQTHFELFPGARG